MSNLSSVIWGTLLHLFCHLFLEVTACTHNGLSTPSKDLSHHIKTHLNGAPSFFPSVCLNWPFHSLPTTHRVHQVHEESQQPLCSSTLQMDFPKGEFHGNEFLYLQLPYVLFSKSVWQLFSSDIFSSTLRKKVILFMYLKSHCSELPYRSPNIGLGKFRVFFISLCSLNRSVGVS